jgi:hypothetical protein
MSHSIAKQPATSSLRGFCARVWNDPESRSTVIGIVGVILIHLLLWWISPHLLQLHPIAGAVRPHATPREFNIEIDSETLAKSQKQKDPFKFVETNPEAPENVPDKTENFAAQNQQAAQEKPTPDAKGDRAATEGKKDFESNQIVSGRLTEPIERVEAPPPPPVETPPVETPPVAAPRAEQTPLAGTEKFEGESQTGFGGNIAKRLPNSQPVPERVEGVKDAPQSPNAMSMQPAIDPLRPRPRPQVVRQQQVRPAILAENKFGTKNVGLTGIDAKWSNYGAYLQRMIDTVQIQWERLILSMSAMPAGGSTVTVKFIMGDEGQITNIVNVDSTASETGSRACVSAITDRAPYGPWTEDMKAVLGSQQEMTFTFYYQ